MAAAGDEGRFAGVKARENSVAVELKEALNK
jgi:hypothetical protein